MDYDRSRSDTVSASAKADLPTRGDPPAPREQRGLDDVERGRVGTVYYNCYKRTAHDATPYSALSGFKIDLGNGGGYTDLIDNSSHGSTRVDVDPSGNSLTVTCDAESHVCEYEDHDISFGYWAPDNVEQDVSKWTAYAERTVQVHLMSREKTQKVGEKNALVITTRDLCCGGDIPGQIAKVADVVSIVARYGASFSVNQRPFKAVSAATPRRAVHDTERPLTFREMAVPTPTPEPQSNDASAAAPAAREPGTMTAREANELSETVKEAMIQSAGSRQREVAEPLAYFETDLFQQQLHHEMVQTVEGRAVLDRGAAELVGEDVAKRLGRRFGTAPEALSCGHVSTLPVRDLADIAGIDLAAARRLRLACLGVVFADDDSVAE